MLLRQQGPPEPWHCVFVGLPSCVGHFIWAGVLPRGSVNDPHLLPLLPQRHRPYLVLSGASAVCSVGAGLWNPGTTSRG